MRKGEKKRLYICIIFQPIYLNTIIGSFAKSIELPTQQNDTRQSRDGQTKWAATPNIIINAYNFHQRAFASLIQEINQHISICWFSIKKLENLRFYHQCSTFLLCFFTAKPSEDSIDNLQYAFISSSKYTLSSLYTLSILLCVCVCVCVYICIYICKNILPCRMFGRTLILKLFW